MAYAGLHVFMDELNHLINSTDHPIINHPEIIHERPQFQLLYDELHSMIQTLFIDQHQDLQKLNDLKRRFTDAAEEAQYIVDLFIFDVHIRNNESPHAYGYFKPSLNLEDVRRSLNSIKVEFMNMDSSGNFKQSLNQSPAARISFTGNIKGSKKLMDEIVVGIDCDVELIRDKLVEDQKNLDVVSIVGMGGIGKTTLAIKVFNDGYVKHHFHVRVWVTVSQTYDKRDVLTQILESIRGQLDLEKASDSKLRELVHKNLMGKRYLIVIDDIWDIGTWDNLKLFFPHDNNGSRVLLTSRLIEVAKHANSDGLIHQLGYLNKERSWELLCKKVFQGNECPEWSIKPGMQIVENCQGLPLAVVLIAGVLAEEALNEKLWEEFLIRRVRWLIWLWVAAGFIQQAGDRSLEDIAEGNLMDLIDRNLVIVEDRRNSNGAVKACKVHDLVRELCVLKAKEEGFILQTERLILSSKFSNGTTPPYKPVHVSINKNSNTLAFPCHSVQNLRSVLWFSEFISSSNDIAKYFSSFVLLRVLDLQTCRLEYFPDSMKLLVHLRYLAIWNSSNDFPPSICNFWNLQTLIYFSNREYVVLPANISDLASLRHLRSYGRSTRGWLDFKNTIFLTSIEKPMKLQTISNVVLGDGVDYFQNCFPCIKELTCTTYSEKENDFHSLIYLEKIKYLADWIPLMNDRPIGETSCGKNHITFPAALKTLTLKGCCLAWSDMSVIQSLPNLEVLKLKGNAFDGSCWNTNEQEFRQLKFLRLDRLDIKQWEAYSSSFPCLRQLQISCCKHLEEIPLEIGDIPTLELIKIMHCRHSVGESVRRIEEEQHDFGNYDLKTDISEDACVVVKVL